MCSIRSHARSPRSAVSLPIALAAQAQGDAGVREKARIDWLVQAASIPATRWHGLYALTPKGTRFTLTTTVGRVGRPP